MFKLDLSAVVSKYIGETEKNLEQVFDAASAGNLVLFFDEADALFGKRSEVKDARDRYANIEVSYLLQRLESYDGLVVMATNFEKNIDEAFLRRIHARVEFAMPGAAERRAIWEHNLPATAPVEDVDVGWFAVAVRDVGRWDPQRRRARRVLGGRRRIADHDGVRDPRRRPRISQARPPPEAGRLRRVPPTRGDRRRARRVWLKDPDEEPPPAVDRARFVV